MSEFGPDLSKHRFVSADIFTLAEDLQTRASGNYSRAAEAPDGGWRDLYTASALAYDSWAAEIERIAQDIQRIEQSAQVAQEHVRPVVLASEEPDVSTDEAEPEAL
jgi:hypothetical protein